MPNLLALVPDRVVPYRAALAEFTEVAHWTRFLAAWCEPGRATPRIGHRGTGAAREIVALHDGLLLHSVFQPILSRATLQPVAFEALIRAETVATAQSVSPEQLFLQGRARADGPLIDRLCRFLHLLNFERQAPGTAALYLNLATVHLQTVQQGQHGSFLGAMQDLCPLAPTRIILEITETQFDDREALASIVDTFKARGYRVAIDDFGARHSNFDRLWALSPDIVKIDRELLLQAQSNPRARKVLPKIVEIIHDLGAAVVCEGIETPEQLELAMGADVDSLQGYLFARPDRDLSPASTVQGRGERRSGAPAYRHQAH